MIYCNYLQLKIKRIQRRFMLMLDMIYERVRGLDFSMGADSSYVGGAAYSKTNARHIHQIFEGLDFDLKLKLIDIGCGKGKVICEAAKYGFLKISGIEYDEKLTEICKKNIEKLKLKDRVSCLHGDALKFKDYGDYNVFFIFNTFPNKPLFEELLHDIMVSKIGKEYFIIYHHPIYKNLMLNKGFEEINKLEEPSRNYETSILRYKEPK